MKGARVAFSAVAKAWEWVWSPWLPAPGITTSPLAGALSPASQALA